MDGTAPIMCRITVNGTITSFSCKLNVKPKQWNVEEVHKVLKCYAFDKDLEEYLNLKKEFESYIREEV